MSIIQQLRDKSAILLSGIIAISLIGFLVQDAFVGRSSSLFSGPSSTVGSVNGENIDAREFNDLVRAMEESNRQQGAQSGEMMTQNIIESIWNGYIQKIITKEQVDNLGLGFTAKEMSALLFSEDAPSEFRQLFTNQQTGQYDIEAAKTWFNNVKKSNRTEDVKMVNDQLIEPLINRQLIEKYASLLTGGSYIPKWMIEKMNNDNNKFASIDYVITPYSIVTDTSVTISDKEIDAYVKDHKEEFKQEKSRSISYIAFDANPTATDTAAVYNKLNGLLEDFKNTTDTKAFVARNGSKIPFFDGFVLKSRLAMDNKDLLTALPVNAVTGPYLDAGSFVIAKKLESKSLPDSIKVRHILVATVDPRTGQVRRSDTAASKTADSIFALVKGGANFGALAAQLSDDGGSKNNGGEYDYSSVDLGNTAKEFADFGFNKKAGERGIVKTIFGYHVMEVISQKNFQEAYKIAYVSKPIIASDLTDNAASMAATQFANSSRSAKAFEENATKLKLSKRVAENIREMDYVVADMPSRSFVKWVYDNKVGTVSEPYDFKDKYVVALITGSFEEGTQPAYIARVQVEPILRTKKRAEIVHAKVGSAATLDAISAASPGSQRGHVDTLKFGAPIIPNVGPELKVIGAAFNKENVGKASKAIDGQNGVYYIQASAPGALPDLAGDIESQRRQMQMQMRQYTSYQSLEALRKGAKIEDKRRKAGF
ncbi:MAG: peptidylprolyl isomerase [Chitinophagaceae bacterium]